MLQLVEKNGNYHVSGSYLGVRVRESTGFSVRHKTEAHDKLREVEDLIAKGEYKKTNLNGYVVGGKSMDFTAAAQGYMQSKRREGDVPQDLVNKVENFVDAWGKTKLSNLTIDVVEDWFDREHGHLAPGSILRYMTQFKAITNHAARRGWMAKLELPMPSVDDERDEHFDLDEVERFLAWVRVEAPWAEMTFTLLIDTGMRLGEAHLCRWNHIKAHEVHVRKKKKKGLAVKQGKTKTKRLRAIPLTHGLSDLVNVNRGEPLEPVMLGKKGNPYASADSASAILNKVLKKGCRAIGAEPLRVHDLRHTFAFLCATAGADLGDLQLLMGHERLDMTLRYRGFIPSRAVDVLKRLRTPSQKI